MAICSEDCAFMLPSHTPGHTLVLAWVSLGAAARTKSAQRLFAFPSDGKRLTRQRLA
jgi:hypothetical protein